MSFERADQETASGRERGRRGRKKEKKKLCLVTETCCVAIVGDDVLIEPQTVWFFRPEVSFKQARKKEKCI